MGWLETIVRFLVSAVVLIVVSWISPGFSVQGGIWGALVVALVIAGLGFLAQWAFGEKLSSNGRGIVSFIVAAVVIYLTQFIVPSFLNVSIIGALIAAFVIGLIDMVVPTFLR